jgi:hypothetical protein
MGEARVSDIEWHLGAAVSLEVHYPAFNALRLGSWARPRLESLIVWECP